MELTHITPYLPYGLKIFVCLKHYKTQLFLNVDNIMTIEGVIKKPILRPLSELTEFLENLQENIHTEQWQDEWIEHFLDFTGKTQEANIDACPYDLIQILFENHFDVFGLIPKGLAINKNTLIL
tara:strand:- start:8273 stop:8644 length:372 start_codon:yes stop_codon:yes gene_type:complete